MPSATSKGCTKDRHGKRNKKCKAWRVENLRGRHKAYLLERHMATNKNDTVAEKALKALWSAKPLRPGLGLAFLGKTDPCKVEHAD